MVRYVVAVVEYGGGCGGPSSSSSFERDYNNDYNLFTLASERIERLARHMAGEFLQWENRSVEEMIFCAIFPTQGST